MNYLMSQPRDENGGIYLTNEQSDKIVQDLLQIDTEQKISDWIDREEIYLRSFPATIPDSRLLELSRFVEDSPESKLYSWLSHLNYSEYGAEVDEHQWETLISIVNGEEYLH